MIICGYAGVGKSTAAKNLPNVVDLESTPFKKNWKLYADVAQHMNNNGYIVLLSWCKEIRDELLARGQQFFVAVPSVNHKESYRQRYIERGNTQEFIDLQMDNWEKWLEDIYNDRNEYNIIVLQDKEDGTPESLTDALNMLSSDPEYLNILNEFAK